MNPHEIRQIGPYPVRRFVAEGGMAWVFEVVDPRFDAVRALKMLKPEAAVGAEFTRFEEEAKKLARLDHPSLVSVYDFGEDEATGCYYYTMTFIDGPTLSERMNEPGFIPIEELVRIFMDVLAGLAKLHDAGVVHRDVKPSNILLTSDGHAVLSDLGIARDASTSSGLTRTGTAVGTALYMSPEQARGRPVDPASDVFSTGLTFYHALTERTVYDDIDEVDSTSGQDILMYLGSLIHSQGELSFNFRKGTPRPLQDLVRKACRFNPEHRFQTAGEMRRALEEATWGRPARSGGGRGTRLGLGIAAGVLVLALGAGLAWLLLGRNAGDAAATVDGLTRLDEQVGELIDGVAALDPPPPADLIKASRKGRSRAEVLRSSAADALAREDFDAVDALASSVREELGGVCARLTKEVLGPRADERAADVELIVQTLADVGAEEKLPDAWTSLQQSLAGLQTQPAADEPCHTAAAARARLGAALDARTQALALQDDLKAQAQRLAMAARAAAIAARDQAEAAKTDAPPYAAAMSEAEDNVRAADALRDKKEHFEAVEVYRRAEKAYREAVTIGPAAKARAETRRLEAEAAKLGVQDVGPASRHVSRADQLYADRSWEAATADYQRANELLAAVVADVGQSQQARAAAAAAEKARDDAVAKGAERQGLLANADRTRDSAAEAFRRKEYDSAEAAYRDAEVAYTAAAGAMEKDLASAKDEGEAARKTFAAAVEGGKCEGLESPAGREACGLARDELDAGEVALGESNPRLAVTHFQTAVVRVQRARQAELDYLKGLPRPPEIASHSPSRSEVGYPRNRRVTFSVDARDPNGDPLRYRWLVDGEVQSASGPSLELTTVKSAKVEVEVQDQPRGAQPQTVRQSWQMRVAKNQRPELSLSPAGRQTIAPGQKLTFSAKARDPDGDPIDIEYLLDGRTVARGASYTFEEQAEKTYTLTARVKDGAGAQTSLQRQIRVARAEPTPAPAPAPPKETPRAPEPAPRPPPESASSGVQALISAYEDAYGACDVDQLSSVWRMRGSDRLLLQSVCKKCDGLAVSVKLDDVKIEGGKANIAFEQWIECRKTGMLQRQDLRASLIQRSGGEWQITEIWE